MTRTAKGVRKSQTPRAIIDTTPKRALRILPHGIFVGKGGRLRLAYAFKKLAHQEQDVPFDYAWNTIYRSEMRKAFPTALEKAMATRGKKGRYSRELAKGRRLVKMGGRHGNSGRLGGRAVDTR